MNNIHSTIHEMHFNSRPSARGDEKIISALEKKVISIHAPPRGATPTRTAASGRPEYFNSRPSARGDRFGCGLNSGHRYFNSRPSARGDRAPDEYVFASDNFNSRPSARGDLATLATPSRAAFAFQFTPLREGRQHQRRRVKRVHLISIHAPPRGATAVRPAPARPAKHFNSRPSARGDRKGHAHGNIGVFQFTPLREGRRI